MIDLVQSRYQWITDEVLMDATRMSYSRFMQLSRVASNAKAEEAWEARERVVFNAYMIAGHKFDNPKFKGQPITYEDWRHIRMNGVLHPLQERYEPSDAELGDEYDNLRKQLEAYSGREIPDHNPFVK